ncbi:MAG: PH domain-containing protein [Paludibacteraceae bacterium]
MKTIYACSMSKTVRWVTAVFFILVVGAILWTVVAVPAQKGWETAVVVAILLLSMLSVFCVYPQYIISDEEGIGVHTLLFTKRIGYDNIQCIKRVTFDGVRAFGIGGALGYIGWFAVKGHGMVIAFLTDPQKAFLVVRKKGRPIAISVDEPDEFTPYYMKQESEDTQTR